MEATLDIELEQRRQLLDAWVATRQRIAELEAEASALLAERMRVCDAEVREHAFHRDAIYRSMVSEYAAAGHLTRASVEFAFADAQAVDADFPAVRESFARGAISAAHVREIARAGAILREAVLNARVDAEAFSLYEAAVLVVAEQDTAPRTRVHARQVASVLAEETVKDRHVRAADERCVTVRPLEDGLALLTAVLPQELALAIHDRITTMARHVIETRDDREPVLDPMSLHRGPDPVCPEHIAPDDPYFDLATIFGDDTFTSDPLAGASAPEIEHVPVDLRSIDQVRADLFIDLLLASDPSEAHGSGLDHISARIQVTVAATTLAGVDDRLAELDGHGPLHPDIARELAGRNGGWSRLFLDPSGMVVETDTYSPTEPMRRHLRARDQHCRFPGCRMPVHRCEIDHNHDHAKGGRTRIDNLAHFCVSHHSLKHPDIDERHRWTARAQPDGSIAWHSPLGRTYLDRPPRRVMFV